MQRVEYTVGYNERTDNLTQTQTIKVTGQTTYNLWSLLIRSVSGGLHILVNSTTGKCSQTGEREWWRGIRHGAF